MKDYEIPKVYLIGTIAQFINGTGNGNAHDFYAAVCDGAAPIIGESCHNNPNSPTCQYFAGQGYVVIVAKSVPPCQ